MTDTRCVLRDASPDDAERLSDLALRSKAHWNYPPGFLDACRAELTYTPQDIRAPNASFVIAEIDGEIVGFNALIHTSATECELEALFIEPARIAGGMGRVLLDDAIRRAREAGKRRIVIQGDPNAAGFYRAAGAVPDGERESDSIPGRYLPLFVIDLG